MTDDIVTRMRSVDFNCDYCQTWEACLEAADEIERLRADRDNWKIIAENLTALQDSPEWDLAILRYERAVRNEG